MKYLRDIYVLYIVFYSSLLLFKCPNVCKRQKQNTGWRFFKHPRYSVESNVIDDVEGYFEDNLWYEALHFIVI